MRDKERGAEFRRAVPQNLVRLGPGQSVGAYIKAEMAAVAIQPIVDSAKPQVIIRSRK